MGIIYLYDQQCSDHLNEDLSKKSLCIFICQPPLPNDPIFPTTQLLSSPNSILGVVRMEVVHRDELKQQIEGRNWHCISRELDPNIRHNQRIGNYNFIVIKCSRLHIEVIPRLRIPQDNLPKVWHIWANFYSTVSFDVQKYKIIHTENSPTPVNRANLTPVPFLTKNKPEPEQSRGFCARISSPPIDVLASEQAAEPIITTRIDRIHFSDFAGLSPDSSKLSRSKSAAFFRPEATVTNIAPLVRTYSSIDVPKISVEERAQFILSHTQHRTD